MTKYKWAKEFAPDEPVGLARYIGLITGRFAGELFCPRWGRAYHGKPWRGWRATSHRWMGSLTKHDGEN
jgi:hypothetical protein